LAPNCKQFYTKQSKVKSKLNNEQIKPIFHQENTKLFLNEKEKQKFSCKELMAVSYEFINHDKRDFTERIVKAKI
jgi:hypothetical protein